MKRSVDILIALVIAILFSVPFLCIMLLVRISLGKPIFFSQVRPGRFGQPFFMIKFRTMTDARGGDGQLLPDADRLTLLGRKLRETSLDELPELWNVIRGDMSLVGPRPLLMEYLPLYSREQARRHEVRPGITGWAQINGRNTLSWEERFNLDVWYVENQSLWLDIKILFLTIRTVLMREGVNARGEATMPKFRGSSKEDGVVCQC